MHIPFIDKYFRWNVPHDASSAQFDYSEDSGLLIPDLPCGVYEIRLEEGPGLQSVTHTIEVPVTHTLKNNGQFCSRMIYNSGEFRYKKCMSYSDCEYPVGTSDTDIDLSRKCTANIHITGGGGGGGSCFIAGTLVSTPNGDIPIQNLNVGDKVYSFNEHNDKVDIDIIYEVISHTPEEDTFGLYKITTKTNEVTTTGNHPFVKLNSEYEDNGADWTSARLLKIGDKIYDEGGIAQTIISIEKLNHKENTYNLEIENNHTYIADGFRVHNSLYSRKRGKNKKDDVGTFARDLPTEQFPDGEIPKYEIGGRVGKNNTK